MNRGMKTGSQQTAAVENLDRLELSAEADRAER